MHGSALIHIGWQRYNGFLQPPRWLGALSALLLCGPGLSLAQSTPPESTNSTSAVLTVHVTGLESNTGRVQIALTDADGFDKDDHLRDAALSIENGAARWTVDSIPHGTYAVRLYHDKNANGQLDTNAFGMPKEAYGFSNNARGRFGPPDFEEASFALEKDSLSLTITPN